MKERKATMKKDISAQAMQDLSANSIIQKEKNKEIELEKMKPAMERYVKRHILPKIKKAAKEGNYQICYFPRGKASKYISLVVKFLKENGYSVHPNIFSESFNISWHERKHNYD